MNGRTPSSGVLRTRREPPPFRRVTVVGLDRPAPHVQRVTFDGPELGELIVDEPAASVRLLLPSPGTPNLVIPIWNGNEFLLPNGQRPTIRTFTPIRTSTATSELVLEIVLHGSGAASDWATAATVGDRAAISGPGRGYVADPDASSFLLVGDESAVPAIGQLIASLPPGYPVHAGIEVTSSRRSATSQSGPEPRSTGVSCLKEHPRERRSSSTCAQRPWRRGSGSGPPVKRQRCSESGGTSLTIVAWIDPTP